MLQNIKPTQINEKCTLLHGFSTRMLLADCGGPYKKGIFKTDLANKQISTKNVHQIIADIAMQKSLKFLSVAFKAEVKRQLIGKYFIMSYNAVSFQISDIEFDEDENTLFERRDGVKISYKEYLRKQYAINPKMKEVCVIKCSKNNAYLPQFAHLTLKSDEIDDLKDQIQQFTNHSVEEQLLSANGLVQHLNKTQQQQQQQSAVNEQKQNEPPPKVQQKFKSLQYGLSIQPQCIRTNAIKLNYPQISLMAFGNKIKTTPLDGQFRWGGRDGTK